MNFMNSDQLIEVVKLENNYRLTLYYLCLYDPPPLSYTIWYNWILAFLSTVILPSPSPYQKLRGFRKGFLSSLRSYYIVVWTPVVHIVLIQSPIGTPVWRHDKTAIGRTSDSLTYGIPEPRVFLVGMKSVAEVQIPRGPVNIKTGWSTFKFSRILGVSPSY